MVAVVLVVVVIVVVVARSIDQYLYIEMVFRHFSVSSLSVSAN